MILSGVDLSGSHLFFGTLLGATTCDASGMDCRKLVTYLCVPWRKLMSFSIQFNLPVANASCRWNRKTPTGALFVPGASSPCVLSSLDLHSILHSTSLTMLQPCLFLRCLKPGKPGEDGARKRPTQSDRWSGHWCPKIPGSWAYKTR